MYLSFCTPKGAIKKMKRRCTEWENIFANDVANRGLIKQLNIKKQQQQQQRMTQSNIGREI